MGNINEINKVSEQYSTPQNLDIRISIHKKYSTNKLGFGNWIYNHYEFFDGCKILELGCGNGNMWTNKTDVIGDKAELILSDLSDGMLDEAKIKLGKYNNIQFKKIDIMDIPYEDETFDFVIANMMLYHIPDLQKGLLEVKRVLKQKGVFYCATFGENGINQYISSVLMPGKIKDEYSFTLQNGKSKLEKFFANTKKIKYEDSLEVTNTKDLVDYIYTTISFNSIESDLSRDEVESIFEEKKQSRAIRIPKEYGMFISYK